MRLRLENAKLQGLQSFSPSLELDAAVLVSSAPNMHFLALAFAILLSHAPRANAGSLGAQGGDAPEEPGLSLMGRTKLRVPIATTTDVDVFASSSYSASASPGAPLLVFLHGFCLPDAEQQSYSVNALRYNAGGGQIPRQQTLSQFNGEVHTLVTLHVTLHDTL